MQRRLVMMAALVVAAVALVPTAASAHDRGWSHDRGWGHHQSRSFGATTLDVDPGTLSALGSLGVTPGAVRPATLDGAQYSFPIVSSPGSVLRSGVLEHRGGISLTAGKVTVKLTDFGIDANKRQLFGEVNGSEPVALANLDFSAAQFSYKWGRLTVGPVKASLTDGAAAALNQAFGTDALSSAVVLGQVTVNYRAFGF